MTVTRDAFALVQYPAILVSRTDLGAECDRFSIEKVFFSFLFCLFLGDLQKIQCMFISNC